MTVYEFAILLAATGLVLAGLAWDLHRLPVRLLVRTVEQFLHHAATHSQDHQEPLP